MPLMGARRSATSACRCRTDKKTPHHVDRGAAISEPLRRSYGRRAGLPGGGSPSAAMAADSRSVTVTDEARPHASRRAATCAKADAASPKARGGSPISITRTTRGVPTRSECGVRASPPGVRGRAGRGDPFRARIGARRVTCGVR